jgi:hypothetical protein
MCGRYCLSRRKQLIQEYFDTSDEVDWEPRYNIAPSQSVGIIRQDPAQPERRFSLARWGLIPYWAKDASIGYKLINARSERVGSKPAFREAFESRTVEVRRPRQGRGYTSSKANLPTRVAADDRRSAAAERRPFGRAWQVKSDSRCLRLLSWSHWEDT